MFLLFARERCHGPSWSITESSPISLLLKDDKDYGIYVAIINWLTVILTGFGLETFMLLLYLQDGWTSNHEIQWKLAQYLFSILALTTLGLASLRNYTANLTLVIGLWKVRLVEYSRDYLTLFQLDTTNIPHLRLSQTSLDFPRRSFQCIVLSTSSQRNKTKTMLHLPNSKHDFA